MHALSPCLTAAVASFLVAIVIKVVALLIRTRHWCWRDVVAVIRSGGMPSSHAATVAGLGISVGVVDGFGSPGFAMAVVLAAVVMTDATQVRRAVGEQGESLRLLIQREDGPEAPEAAPKSGAPYRAMGHTPLEVLVGAALGVVVGLAVAGAF